MNRIEPTLESVATGLNYLMESLDDLKDEFHATRDSSQNKREVMAGQLASLEAKVKWLEKLVWGASTLAATATVGLLIELAIIIGGG